MDGAAKPWRVLVLLSFMFCSCATTTYQAVNEDSSVQEPSIATEVSGATDDRASTDENALVQEGEGLPYDSSLDTYGAATDLTVPAALEPEPLLVSADGQFGISRVAGQGFDRFEISPVAGVSKPRVSKLTMPARLVVDLAGVEGRLNRVFESPDSNFVTRVRVGAYSDKSRVVFDLREDSAITHDVSSEGNRVLITLSAGSNAKPAVSVKQESAETAAVPEDSPIILAHAEKQDLKKSSLTGLRIESLGAENVLIAELDGASRFALDKTAPSEYVLKLNAATLNPEAARTILSPVSEGSIRSARPSTSGDDVLIRIFASPSGLLEAKAKGSRVFVKVASVSDELLKDVRAQAATDGPQTATGAAAPAKGAEAAKAAEIAAGGVSVSESAADTVAGSDIADEDLDVEAALLEEEQYTGRLISLDLQDTDIDNALRIIAEVSNLNIIASDDVTGKVTLRLIDVPWDQALDVILKTNGLDKVREGNVIRIAPVEKLRQEREALITNEQAKDNLEPLRVRYVRVSYARASDMKPLVESVLTERGTVTYDERTNQVIVKDITRGLKNVAQLVKKLDLRTPQVLLETQIVEAKRSLTRELGAELGYSHIQAPEIGNATGDTFPNAIYTQGSVVPGAGNTLSAFPAAVSSAAGSAISFLFDSADGSQQLSLRLSALESEGRVRVVSRPAVATTNNKPAVIKSVEKLRVKTPSGGLSVATGQGASASGSSAVATEVIEIGITMEVTPQASPDYYVLLDIDAKSSTIGSTFVDGIPSEIERSATSTVLVSSGQTFAMGGIYKISDADSLDGIPFFKDVPFIGHLFRRSKVQNADEELVFFLTPRIIEGSFDDAAMKVTS